MPENIRQVKAISVGVPEEVIEHVGHVLDWPVMHRERIQEQMMPKRFEDEDGTADERIVPGEKGVVPDQLARERREVNSQKKQSQGSVAKPRSVQDVMGLSQARFLQR